jgi:hypothetical protein
MAIEALALLKLSVPPASTSARIDRLDDAVIVHTGADFAADPEELGAALLAAVGEDTLAQHHDPRGILFIPSVAAPKARAYEAVVAEVGEGGSWAQFEDDDDEGAADFGDFGALLGNVMAQMPPSLLSAASAAAQGDRGALDAVSAQVQALLGSSPALQGLAGQLSGMLGQAGPGAAPAPSAELASLESMFASFGGGEAANAAFRDLAGSMQAELSRDPDKLKQLANSLLQGDSIDTEGEETNKKK